MAAVTSIDEYLAAVPDKPRAALERLRGTIRAAAPRAIETIAYDMPAFRIDGRFLVSFGAYRNHCSLFPASGVVREALGDELKPYLSGKGTIRFRADRPLSDDLVTRIVELRLAETAERGPR